MQSAKHILAAIRNIETAQEALREADNALEAQLLDLETPYEYALPILAIREKIFNAQTRAQALSVSLFEDLRTAKPDPITKEELASIPY